MIKVKIGNDVRFNVMLKGDREFDQNNIKRIQSTFVKADAKQYNSIKEELDDKLADLYNKDVHMIDFDNVWYSNEDLDKYTSWDITDECAMHMPNKDCIHLCGPHGYHFGAWNTVNNPQFGRRVVYEMGLRKGIFHSGLVEKDVFAELALKMCPKVRKPGDISPAYSSTTDIENQIHVYFPAKEQKALGKYNLIVKILAYEEGWGPNNLRTYTMEYKNLIELTDDEDGVYPNVTIDVDENGDIYQCGIAVMDLVPPSVYDDNVNLLDQSFETEEVNDTAYSYDKLIANSDQFDVKNIGSDLVTYTLNTTGSRSVSQRFVWIMSTKPIKAISFGDWNLACPFVQVSAKSGEYIYAVSNPISNVSNLKLNVHFT